ncbi:hypothetical protein SAMN04488136_109154 [Vibrio xiamenensis]|uniref:Uncharacterized protein n=1 Tax=Vibrio xiamenensis TaxID=861298 RepID=A0A1G8A5F6_9VIBR|nr:hypothetical protein SAMN04488136_109154 [Vibrio xiamenensis]
MSRTLNIVIPLVGIFYILWWYFFPSQLEVSDSGLVGFFLLYFVLAPIVIIWGLAYAFYKKMWTWVIVFSVIGVIPELFIFPGWAQTLFYITLNSMTN